MKEDDADHYACALMHIYYVLVISEYTEKVIRKEIGKLFELKPESVGPPSMCLGGSARKVILENGVHAGVFSSSQHV